MAVVIISIVLVMLAIYIFIKEIRKALKGRCCDSCKNCSVKDKCEANDTKNEQSQI